MDNTIKLPQLDLIQDELKIINQKIDNLSKGKSIDEMKDLTREETAKFLNICITTLDVHRKTGKIKGYKIGRKRYYTMKEITNLKNNIQDE